MDLLPFTALGWLGLGFIAVGVLRARRSARDRRNHPCEGDDIPGRPSTLELQIPAILIFGRPK